MDEHPPACPVCTVLQATSLNGGHVILSPKAKKSVSCDGQSSALEGRSTWRKCHKKAQKKRPRPVVSHPAALCIREGAQKRPFVEGSTESQNKEVTCGGSQSYTEAREAGRGSESPVQVLRVTGSIFSFSLVLMGSIKLQPMRTRPGWNSSTLHP